MATYGRSKRKPYSDVPFKGNAKVTYIADRQFTGKGTLQGPEDLPQRKENPSELKGQATKEAVGNDAPGTGQGSGLIYKCTIPLQPVTKKNSQQIAKNKAGKPFIVPSAKYKEYIKNSKWFLTIPEAPIEEPCRIECHYYMETCRAVDLTNLLEATDDVLVALNVLKDDNCRIIVSHDGSRVYHDSENPRTEIRIYREQPTFL